MTNTKKREKRSPLRRKALRNPGESLQEEIQRLIDDRLMPPLLMAVLAVAFAVYEWWRSLASAPPQPMPVALLAGLVVAYATYRTIRLRPRLKALQLGLQGEKTVGQSLEALRSRSCRVFHDIPAKGFNVDHVIIGPHGVFAVETKTVSKPAQRSASVTYDGERVLVGGREPDRNPLVQARASRDWHRDLLLEATARRYPVRGVVLLPGWWVEQPGEKKRPDIWVLNPKAFPAFIEREPVVLKEEDIALAASVLTQYVTRE